MTGAKRREVMAQFAANAREADRRCDVTGRVEASRAWRELATEAEAKRAPRYLTWPGREYAPRAQLPTD